MKVGVPTESADGERRVALVPEVVRKLVSDGHEIVVESGAGAEALIPDELFSEAGATIASDAGQVWSADVVVKVARPSSEEIDQLSDSSILIGFLAPLTAADTTRALAASGATAFAMEAIPRISRAQSMDALSSQSNVAGYRAALLGAQLMGRFYPMLMTAAGTIRPAKVLVLGAGVAGLQAIATARRLGAQVQGFDVRSAVKEQVESLGAKFLERDMESAEGEGGYARALSESEQERQRELLGEAMADIDVVITTALVPGKPAPLLVTETAVQGMKPGAVIVDLAGEAGGNCELSEPGETIVRHDVQIAAPLNVPSAMAEHASQLYARNVQSLLGLMAGEDGELELDFDDEIISGACITRDGEIVHQAAREATESAGASAS
jgi:H+-translocating NAD(P) transhydrogenase subunit alpha